MQTWEVVGTLDDVWEGELLEITLAGEAVLVAHLLGGEVVAYQGICPHQEFSLAEGDFDGDPPVLTCPAHHWQFDLTTGAGVNPTGCSLHKYDVRIEDETIMVGVPEGGISRRRRQGEGAA